MANWEYGELQVPTANSTAAMFLPARPTFCNGNLAWITARITVTDDTAIAADQATRYEFNSESGA